MRLGAVAEQNHIARQHAQGADAEEAVAPALVAPEEEHAQQSQHHELHLPVVGQQEGLQAACEEDAHEVGVAMVGGYHVEHLLVEYEDIVERGVECRQQQEEGAAQRGIAEVAPHPRVAEQDGQFGSAIHLGGGGEHDEEDGPEGFSALQQDEGKEVDVGDDDVVLVAEHGLQHDGEQE